MERILIYTPANNRNVEQLSQGELLMKAGYEVFLLTWASEGLLHENFRKIGAIAYSAEKVKGRSLVFLLNQVKYLVNFCKKHHINRVIAHSQANGFVSGIARKFMKAEVYYFRHNSDYYALGMRAKYRWINRWANRLSKIIIAPSRKVKEQLIREGVDEKRIIRINNCYNFSQYWNDSLHCADKIRRKYDADLLLLMVSRLEPLKRHKLSFEVVKKLSGKGVNVKLVSIGVGPIEEQLKKWITENGMQDKIFMEPFRTNAIDYFLACDMLIHLSYSEASANVVKEAAMCDKTVIVCHDVGDFDDYMVHGKNAFLADKENPVDEVVDLLYDNYKDKQLLGGMGKALHEKIKEQFSVEAVEPRYLEILQTPTKT